ncbi:hypothetical protein RU97_GL001250 [Enterococcus canis]|uniref:Uncharacterized protein n=1 Tax=Enterococcus canis TaxID=214095 RepID=A0A1L8RIT9_9ENTE|nr:hypothetical protein RU97_GL001250 [Enterococcus canis]
MKFFNHKIAYSAGPTLFEVGPVFVKKLSSANRIIYTNFVFVKNMLTQTQVNYTIYIVSV